MRYAQHNSGFTLIEAVVSTALFAFVVASILGVYTSILRLDTRTRAQRAVEDNARFIMDFLSKEVRDGFIDYTAAACGAVVTSTTDLCLVNQNNETEHIYAASLTNLLSGAGTDLTLAKTSGTSNLNSASVKITKLKFLVAPVVDPLTDAKVTNEQPHVTVIMEVTSVSTRDAVKIDLQNTFSENYYPSRGGVSAGPSGGPATYTLSSLGAIRDAVGEGQAALSPNGLVDKVFKLQVTGGSSATITALDFRNAGSGGIWDTKGDGFWVIGAANTSGGSLVNNGDGSVSIPVSDGTSFYLFVDDFNGVYVPSGSTQTLTMTFSDSSTATASVLIP